jgi:CheY-like chemotaxis protein/two-component sensor histidine kinase
MRLRNVEFGTITNRLQRTVRVTCDEEGKHAEVVIENGSLEIDTQVIDAVIEPLLHLLKNAVVHGIEPPETRRMLGKPEVGKITVRISNKGAYIVLSVTDDGRGIAFRPLLEKAVASGLVSRAEAEEMTADKIRELIFLPGLTTAQDLSLNAGRGVGMSIVRESVAAKGGVVLIETWPQKGTTFSIRIPRPFADADADPPPPPYARPSGKRRMALVVDDSPSVRLMTASVIEREGWSVETAKDGIEALEKLHAMERPAVILSDIEMPRMGGYELVKAVREDEGLKDIPLVFISSRRRATDREQAAAAGVSEYLTKPYGEKELLEVIERLAVVHDLVSE